jgi:hypothetical protein
MDALDDVVKHVLYWADDADTLRWGKDAEAILARLRRIEKVAKELIDDCFWDVPSIEDENTYDIEGRLLKNLYAALVAKEE